MKKDFLSAVDEQVAASTRGSRTWFDCLDASAKRQLSTVKEKYLKGGYTNKSKRSIAKAVITAAKERGWRVSGIQGVTSWLDRQ